MKRISRKSLILFLAITLGVVSIFAFVGCNKKQTKGKPTEVQFMLDWTPNTNHTGIYVAKALGYYKDEGLNVNIAQPGDTGTSQYVAASNRNKAIFGVDFQEQMYANYFAGVNVKAIAAIQQHNTSGILSLKRDGINSPKDMVGKKHATWGLPVEQTIIEDLIKQDGGIIPTDTNELYNTNYITDSVAALEEKDKTKINSAWVYECWDLVKAKMKDANKFNYFAFKDINKILDWYTPVLIGNEDYMKHNPTVTKKFLRATKKGYEYAINNPEKAAEILMQSAPELQSERDFIIESQKLISKKYYNAEAGEKWGYIDEERWQRFYEYLNSLKDVIQRKMHTIGDATQITDIPTNFGLTKEYLD